MDEVVVDTSGGKGEVRRLERACRLAALLVIGAAISCSDSAASVTTVQQAVDSGSDSGAHGSVDASLSDAALPDAPVSAEDAGPFALLPPSTPNATLDFLATPPPAFALTPVVTFERPDLPDKSVDPPQSHDALTPSDIAFLPDGSGDCLVVLSTGLIVWLDRDFALKGTFQVESSNMLSKYRARGGKFLDNEGVLGLVFDPDFRENGYFYLHLTPEAYGGIDIWRLRWKPDQLDRLWESASLVLHIDKPQVARTQAYLAAHNGGNPSFGPDGMLYLAIGDGGIGGGMALSEQHSQRLDSYWGKLLRMDPHGSSPPEIVAYGLRNPFTHTWRGNEIYIGDVGSDMTYSWEEMNRLVLTGGISNDPPNFGHPLTPGGPCEETPLAWKDVLPDCSGMVDPIYGYRRDDSTFLAEDPQAEVPPPGTSNRQAIILGPAYPGGRYDGYLDNVVLYSDLLQGWVRGILFDATGRVVADRHIVHHDGWKIGFAVGPDGHVYMVGDFASSFSVYRLETQL